ncbi:MAG TPA: nuclear transport factor 2 family protein [Solirubrobacteraceae bacterium]|nr:nuclear transport factor 2 family protein [Solirubrobacteraceae bacterium]
MASTTSTPLETVKQYYAGIDAGNTKTAFALMAEDAVVRFGDHPELVGRDAISERISTMLTLGSSVEHEILRSFESEGPEDRTTVVCEARVTYVMQRSGNRIAHNAVTISEVDPSGSIVRQRNVGDLAPVIADHAAHA